MLSAHKSRVFWLSPNLRQIVVRKAGNPPPNGDSAEPDSGETVQVHLTRFLVAYLYGAFWGVALDDLAAPWTSVIASEADVTGRHADFSD